MHCPFCTHEDTRVIDSRLLGEGDQIRRRRECQSCKARFTTYETAELSLPRIIKNDGRRETFNDEKLRSGVVKALEKRPVSMERVENAINQVKRRIRESGEREIDTVRIGELVMDELRGLAQADPAERDTTLLIHPGVLSDFLDFNDTTTNATLTWSAADLLTPDGTRTVSMTFEGVNFTDGSGVVTVSQVNVNTTTDVLTSATVTVTGINDVPVAVADTATTNDLDRIDIGRIQRKHTLDALAELDSLPEDVKGEPSVLELRLLAHVAGIDALREHNPALLDPVWSGEKYIPEGYMIRLPRDDLKQPLDKLLAALPADARFGNQKPDLVHRIVPGDSLSTIARRYGTTVSKLMALNGMRNNNIRAGKTLLLPCNVMPEPKVASRASFVAQPAAGRAEYVIQRGDSLWSIARRFKVSQQQLVAWNGISSKGYIQPGQKLKVGGSS